ncbi:FAD-dependent monooxygenase [Nocardia sp. CY41]|uniref:FAD-dependent monooxygenase n=1 Tax=Nocardia sp. CY41 TaxID=2608686 RepID=UPI001358A071|nr:FAD-dependent monooxygenase [Nocardia sp. CY41]
MVTIVGGGIAGTVLAGALGREGIPVRVYESRPSVGAGAFLVLDDRAHAALTGLGVRADRLEEVAHPVDALRVEYQPGEARFGPSRGHRLYLRAEFMSVLTEFATTTAAEFHYDTAVTEIDQGVLFSGATRLSTDDIVIAADGIDSLVRRRIEPGRTPEYAGQIVFYGRTERAQALRTKSTVLHFDGRIGADGRPVGAFGHYWDEGLSVWFARVTRPPLPAQDLGFHPVAEWAELIRTVAPGISDVVDGLLAETATVHVSNARNVPFATAASPQLPVILCGDADHAITPAEGVGARDAIEDAAALFHALSTGSSPADAMAARRRQIAADRERVVPPYRRAGN